MERLARPRDSPARPHGTASRPRRGPVRLLLRDPDRARELVAGFELHSRFARERVEAITRAFLTGYNAAVVDFPRVRAALRDVEGFYRPFAYEGAAMGFGPWALLRGTSVGRFEALAARAIPETIYQNYVGLGWWLGLRHRRAESIRRRVECLDHRYRLLVYEGIGFRWGFLHPHAPVGRAGFGRHGPAAAHVCYQGYGRSLWFVQLEALDRARERIAALPAAHRGDAWSGLGLGCAFSLVDHPAAVRDTAAIVPGSHRPDFLQGVAFGWEARRRADGTLFERHVLAPGSPERHRAQVAVEAVATTRAALERTVATGDFYQHWRGRTRALLVEAGFTRC